MRWYCCSNAENHPCLSEYEGNVKHLFKADVPHAYHCHLDLTFADVCRRWLRHCGRGGSGGLRHQHHLHLRHCVRAHRPDHSHPPRYGQYGRVVNVAL